MEREAAFLARPRGWPLAKPAGGVCRECPAIGEERQIGIQAPKRKRKYGWLTVGTSLERIGDESVTRADSGFVHGNM